MNTITISISDEYFNQLKKIAKDENISPEEIVRVNLEKWLDYPSEDFSNAANYIINKNADLYNRLS